MFKVTMKNGEPHWVSATHIVQVFASNEPGLSTIFFDTGTMITVQDKSEDLARIVDSYSR